MLIQLRSLNKTIRGEISKHEIHRKSLVYERIVVRYCWRGREVCWMCLRCLYRTSYNWTHSFVESSTIQFTTPSVKKIGITHLWISLIWMTWTTMLRLLSKLQRNRDRCQTESQCTRSSQHRYCRIQLVTREGRIFFWNRRICRSHRGQRYQH